MALSPDPSASLEQYAQWLIREELMESRAAAKTSYEQNRDLVLEFVKKHAYCKQIADEAPRWTRDFRNQTTYGLFRPEVGVGLELTGKPWDSYFEKTWRLNILDNPDAPKKAPKATPWRRNLPRDWIKPTDLHLVNDVVRGTIVVRYLDGVRFVANRLGDLAESLDLKCEVVWQAQAAGHHAAHVYVDFECDWIDRGTTKRETFTIEIQIMTEIRNVVRDITHWSYENSRVKPRPSTNPESWQWNPSDSAFVPNFLGHLLQYIDGTIVVARDAIREENQ